MLVHLRCSIFPVFFFSTQFKQCQSQQISARYGRFNYNTPEYVEKGHFLTNKCCNQPRVSCHVECCNRPFNMLNVSLNENKNGWDRFDPLNESTDLLNDNIFFLKTLNLFSTHSTSYITARHLLSDHAHLF